jgi:hypothetical protein
VYLQRADPLGAGKWNVSFAYQYAHLDELDGNDAAQLRNQSAIPINGLLAAIQLSPLDLDVSVHQFLFAASYGITESLEASIAVPVVYSDVAVDVPIAAAAVTPSGELVTFEERVKERETSAGIGDLLLRAKVRLATLTDLHLAGGLQLRLPSGSRQDLLGIGYVEVSPSLIASTRIFEAAPWARLQGHFNGGHRLQRRKRRRQRCPLGIRAGLGPHRRCHGRGVAPRPEPVRRRGPPGHVHLPELRRGSGRLRDRSLGSRRHAAALRPVDRRVDYYTLSIGGRASVWRDTIFAMVNVAVPLNDGFVRTDPIPLIGLESTF